MATVSKYFHDHFVLLLLTINGFLAVAGSVLILLRLSGNQGSSYIVQYRATTGVNDFTTGSISGLLSFVAFAILALVAGGILSHSAYKINRHLSIFILSLTILLLVLTIIISNALLVLR